MSVEIRLARGLRAHVDAPASVVVEGRTVREALSALIAVHPELRRFVLDDAQRLRRHVNIFVNSEQLVDRETLADPITEGDQLHILPAVSGGSR